MAWPELLKAKKNMDNMQAEIEKLVKNHNSFKKEEIAKQDDTLIAEIDNALERIQEEAAEMQKNIINHRKYVRSKSRFLKRHYTRNK